MKIKGRYPEYAKLYGIFLGIGLVAAIAVFILVYNASGSFAPAAEEDKPAQSQTTEKPQKPQGYEVSEELSEEMKDEATTLLSNNYSILKLYYTKGMNHKDEPYGNAPEDGYYTVDSNKYSSLADVEALVDRTFIEPEAIKIKNNTLDRVPGYSKKTGPIYKERYDGSLGINAKFTPIPYTRSWEDPRPTFSIEPVSETECKIIITIRETSDNSDVELEAHMVKTDDGWKLTELVF